MAVDGEPDPIAPQHAPYGVTNFGLSIPPGVVAVEEVANAVLHAEIGEAHDVHVRLRIPQDVAGLLEGLKDKAADQLRGCAVLHDEADGVLESLGGLAVVEYGLLRKRAVGEDIKRIRVRIVQRYAAPVDVVDTAVDPVYLQIITNFQCLRGTQCQTGKNLPQCRLRGEADDERGRARGRQNGRDGFLVDKMHDDGDGDGIDNQGSAIAQ